MLRDISTRRKLFLLCSAFVFAIAVAIYISIAEKRIAIDFARKELGGVGHIEQFQDIYAALLRDPLGRTSPPPFPGATITSGADAKSASQDSLRTAALEDSLKRTLSRLWSGQVTGDAQRSVTAEALTKTERVIARIGDDSGLALDPELDSYHLQDILVRQMPKLLSQLGDVWSLASASQPATPEGKTRLLTRAAIARTTSEELARSLTSAYRGNASGGLRRGTEATMAVMLSSVAAYLGGVDESLTNPDTFDRASLEPLWNSAAEDALTAWTGGLTDLRGLLAQRVDDLMGRLYWSLLIMGTLAGLSILLAFMTHRSIVRPLARLEDLANRVRSTKDYSHRVDYESKDEIGLARITPLPWLLAVTVASVQRLQGSNRTIPPVKFETFGARPRIPLDRCPAVTIALIYNSIS